MPEQPFPYMRWAKAHLNASWGPSNLGMSGVRPPAPEALAQWGLPPAFEVGAPMAALKQGLAERHGMTPANVHVAAGTSHANFIAYLALARGGCVAVERPAYQALSGLAPAVGASLVRFDRDPARDWQLDRASLAAAAEVSPDLFVVTDLHNPSGTRLSPDDLALLVETAQAADAHVLVDEVYADFDPVRRPTAARFHPRVLTTNSLTKAHGLGALRCGWILGDAETIARIEAWDDLVHPEQPPAMLAAAAAYLPQADACLQATRAEAAARADQVDAWVQATPGVTWRKPDGGITGLIELADASLPDGDVVAARAFETRGLRVVSGSFFQAPRALRVSFQLEAGDLATALDGLGALLSELRGARP